MSKIIIIRKNLLKWIGVFCCMAVALVGWYFTSQNSEQSDVADAAPQKDRIIHMVTGEFTSNLPDGTEIEAYRWDPGTIFVEKGEKVKLVIYGVNGESHPFIIEGTQLQGEVKKGQETTLSFKAEREGVYRIICLSHPDSSQNGPMIGYIVVD